MPGILTYAACSHIPMSHNLESSILEAPPSGERSPDLYLGSFQHHEDGTPYAEVSENTPYGRKLVGEATYTASKKWMVKTDAADPAAVKDFLARNGSGGFDALEAHLNEAYPNGPEE